MQNLFGSAFNVNVNHRHRVDSDTKALSPSASNDTPRLTVESMNNHVFYYADVDTDRTLALIRNLREKDEWLRNERMNRDIPQDYPPVPIWLHIQSDGGDLFAGFSAANQIEEISRRTPIYVIAEGVVASAATLLFLAGTKRYALPNAHFLVHQFRTWMGGTHEAFKDEMKLQDKLIEQMVKFYADRTNLSADAVREMLKHDSWFDADEAIVNGFAHEIRR